jgi:hypothetical protein
MTTGSQGDAGTSLRSQKSSARDRWLQARIAIIGQGFRETDFRNAKRKDSAC